MELEKLIKDKLEATINGCEFKTAWIPKGWACVNIDKFSKFLAKEIKNELK